jgi:hypothetical protein
MAALDERDKARAARRTNPRIFSLVHSRPSQIILASRHRSLVFENLALRQQVAVYHRTRSKPTVRWSDRLFWVGLRLAWPDWKSALVIVLT